MELTGKRLLYIGGASSIADIARYTQQHGITLLAAGQVISEEIRHATQEQYAVDVSDRAALREIITGHRIDGVLVIGNEDIIDCVVQVAEETGLPFYVNRHQWTELQNKQNFKKNCRRHGIPVVETYTLTGEKDIPQIPADAFPVVLKPADSCGSKGISVCHSAQALQAAMQKALSFSRSGTFLCEKYMDCPEITVKYLFDRGEITLWEVNDRYVNRTQKGVGAIANGTVYPSKYTQLYLDTLHPKMVALLREFEMYNGTMFMQAFVDGDTIRPYDPGLRFSGGLSYFIARHVFGVNPLECMICAALTGRMYPEGEENPLKKIDVHMNGRHLANFSVLVGEGRIGKITGFEEAAALPEVFKALQLLHEGDEVTRPGTLQQVLGRFQIEADSREQLEEVIRTIDRTVRVEDAAGQTMRLVQTMHIL